MFVNFTCVIYTISRDALKWKFWADATIRFNWIFLFYCPNNVWSYKAIIVRACEQSIEGSIILPALPNTDTLHHVTAQYFARTSILLRNFLSARYLSVLGFSDERERYTSGAFAWEVNAMHIHRAEYWYSVLYTIILFSNRFPEHSGYRWQIHAIG